MNHTIKNAFLKVEVPQLGAELQSIQDAQGKEYLWQGVAPYWEQRAINLFPYVGRLTEGTYCLDGKTYQMPIHGFAPWVEFRLTEKGEDFMVCTLTDNEELYAQYPRHFAFRVCYRLEGNRLQVTFEVENRDEKMLYFGLGGHPGFQVPMEQTDAFSDYRLRFTKPCKPKMVDFTEKCFVTGTKSEFPLVEDQFLPLRHELFDNDAMVLTEITRDIVLEKAGGKRSVRVAFPQMPYVGIWHTTKSDAPFVCIEPWCSLPSQQDVVADLEEQKDLLSLAPGKTYVNNWSITIE